MTSACAAALCASHPLPPPPQEQATSNPWLCNAFTSSYLAGSAAAVYQLASRFNHSCRANCAYALRVVRPAFSVQAPAFSSSAPTEGISAWHLGNCHGRPSTQCLDALLRSLFGSPEGAMRHSQGGQLGGYGPASQVYVPGQWARRGALHGRRCAGRGAHAGVHRPGAAQRSVRCLYRPLASASAACGQPGSLHRMSRCRWMRGCCGAFEGLERSVRLHW